MEAKAATGIVPSPAARQIYNMMVTRAETMTEAESGGEELQETLHLTLANTIELACTLRRAGEDMQARAIVAELRAADWIKPASHGGWMIG